ncbi:hypothetical protein NG798_19720 [Ancylothrix sp. C2]|uniref:hypothetical protein n=1 Tax=Ancylothrix sp. D3o TaxID=2953691 RepID=UPI0021BA8450|nr:hypothetical protein [Ancylothrix sp. D3o]MCT7952031.1 hypothetical protein [Ancylothrix sp. D3o]
MGTFLKLATTTTLALGLHLMGAGSATSYANSNLLSKISLSNLDSENTLIAEYEPKDNGGPKTGEDAGTHFWQEVKGGPA